MRTYALFMESKKIKKPQNYRTMIFNRIIIKFEIKYN